MQRQVGPHPQDPPLTTATLGPALASEGGEEGEGAGHREREGVGAGLV